jgi:hypothetical protein
MADESCNPADWLLASDDPKKLADGDPGVAALADQLFDERVGAGEPVIAWWYWRPLPLPAPLDRVGRADGPQRLRVTVDDYVVLIPKYRLCRAVHVVIPAEARERRGLWQAFRKAADSIRRVIDVDRAPYAAPHLSSGGQ